MKLKIKLNTIDSVRKFTEYSNELSCDAFIRHGRYKVDAKSVMGIFSLDLLNNLDLYIEPMTDKQCEETNIFLQNIRKMDIIIKEE